MRTPEGVLKDKIKSFLEKQGAYYFMPVQSGYGRPSLDILICYKGRFIAVETKSPGNTPTPRQDLSMRDIALAGGTVAFFDNFEDFLSWWNKYVLV